MDASAADGAPADDAHGDVATDEAIDSADDGARSGDALTDARDEGISKADAAPEGGRKTMSLKVLTFNGWTMPSADNARDIMSTGADIVGAQETSAAEARELAALLGPGWSFAQDAGQNDFAILSRYPILRRIGVTAADRGALGATIEIAPGWRVHVFNTHLVYTPYGPYQLVDGMTPAQVVASETQVHGPSLTELLNMAAPFVASAEPTFLTGDFNAPSDLDYSPPVAWPTSVACRNAGFVDSYFELHPNNPKKTAGQFLFDDPGVTWTSIPSSEPKNCFDRIDFVYYSKGDATPKTSDVLTIASSDHRVVVTSFELSSPVATAKASEPLPANAATAAPRHPLLTWLPAAGATSYQLFLGTSSPGTMLGAVADSKAWTALLARNTTYYWRVDAVTPTGTVTGDVWTFVTGAGGGVNPSKTSYAPNETISVAFDGMTSATDWIGLYKTGEAFGTSAASLSWKYANDTTTAPAAVTNAGTVTLAGQPTPGDYRIRLFASGGYVVLDEIAIEIR
jgi:endonuclease/exonuclease/phosphatase (EEP) superfamily protein YafD